jgi:hypothetical protein
MPLFQNIGRIITNKALKKAVWGVAFSDIAPMVANSTMPSNYTKYLAERIPSFSENFHNSWPKATLEFLVDGLVQNLGNNPTTTTFIRDTTKLPGILMNIYSNNTHGSTKYYYDESSIWSAFVKSFACKGIIIGGTLASSLANPNALTYLPSVARASNYICEPIARFVTIAGQSRQDDKKTHESFWDYTINNFKMSWAAEAVTSGLLKTFVTDSIGELFGRSGIPQAWRSASLSVQSSVAGAELRAGSIFSKLNQADVNFFSFTAGALSTLEIISKIGYDMVVSYIIIPPARWAQDALNTPIKYITNLFKYDAHNLVQKQTQIEASLLEALQIAEKEGKVIENYLYLAKIAQTEEERNRYIKLAESEKQKESQILKEELEKVINMAQSQTDEKTCTNDNSKSCNSCAKDVDSTSQSSEMETTIETSGEVLKIADEL